MGRGTYLYYSITFETYIRERNRPDLVDRSNHHFTGNLYDLAMALEPVHLLNKSSRSYKASALGLVQP